VIIKSIVVSGLYSVICTGSLITVVVVVVIFLCAHQEACYDFVVIVVNFSA
jgi:hypothetical protein